MTSSRQGRVALAASPPSLVTVPNVEIVEAGIEYPLSNGVFTFTPEDIWDMVASQDDPAIQSPRLKIGHIDPRFNGLVDPTTGAVYDGEPAIGKVVNLRLSEDKLTVIGDYVGVPRWLAEIMPIAYPSRSFEGSFDVETSTGNTWRIVITAVALLGVVWPGIQCLEDLPLLYSEEGPEGVQVITTEDGDPMGAMVAAAGPAQVAAAVNTDDVRRQYYDSLDSSQIWWWIRAMYIDPNELIVDDDEGQLYRVSFTVNGDTAEFGEPQSVKIEYVNATSGGILPRIEGIAQARANRVAVFASRSESRPEATNQEGTTMIDVPALRTRLGLTAEQLPDDANEEQINAAIAASAETPPATTPPAPATPPPATEPQTPGTPTTPETPAAPAAPETPPPAQTTQAATLPPGTRLVDEAEWEATKRDAQAGASLATQNATETRDREINAAVQAGKFPASRKQHWQDYWDKDPQGAKAAIDALAAGLVPVSERGASPVTDDYDGNGEAYPAAWLPEVTANAGQQPTPTITQEVTA